MGEPVQFVCADGSDFVADVQPDAVVMNEVLYYLPDPWPPSRITRAGWRRVEY